MFQGTWGHAEGVWVFSKDPPGNPQKMQKSKKYPPKNLGKKSEGPYISLPFFWGAQLNWVFFCKNPP